MDHKDFKIGQVFWIGRRKFLVTDLGMRTVIGIAPNLFDEDGQWEPGPPYGVAEIVFDENDLPGCSTEEAKE